MRSFIKNLSIVDGILLFSLLLLVTIIGVDLFRAINGTQCIGGIRDDCYPWGFEGPIAEIWYYRSKSRYLIHTALSLSIFIGAAFSLSAFPKTKKKTWAVVIALLCFGLLSWLLNRVLVG